MRWLVVLFFFIFATCQSFSYRIEEPELLLEIDIKNKKQEIKKPEISKIKISDMISHQNQTT